MKRRNRPAGPHHPTESARNLRLQDENRRLRNRIWLQEVQLQLAANTIGAALHHPVSEYLRTLEACCRAETDYMQALHDENQEAELTFYSRRNKARREHEEATDAMHGAMEAYVARRIAHRGAPIDAQMIVAGLNGE